MASPRRIEKLDILFREQIASIVDREIEFSDGVFVTITRVMISSDARHANAYISVFGGDERDALAILQKNVYHIQQAVNRAVRMRPVPKIRFAIDEEERRREEVERSLGAMKQKGEIERS
ncbi:MAG: ribosome-binding factor A [Candidatus Sungiibacteriota bacterium]